MQIYFGLLDPALKLEVQDVGYLRDQRRWVNKSHHLLAPGRYCDNTVSRKVNLRLRLLQGCLE